MGTYRALIIACDLYTQDFIPIPNTVSDARAFGEALATFGYTPFEVQYCLDDINSNVTDLVGKFFSSSKQDDLALFYFGGHGRKDDDGDLYLVLRDTKLKE